MPPGGGETQNSKSKLYYNYEEKFFKTSETKNGGRKHDPFN
jgi:hypothetical protein